MYSGDGKFFLKKEKVYGMMADIRRLLKGPSVDLRGVLSITYVCLRSGL